MRKGFVNFIFLKVFLLMSICVANAEIREKSHENLGEDSLCEVSKIMELLTEDVDVEDSLLKIGFVEIEDSVFAPTSLSVVDFVSTKKKRLHQASEGFVLLGEIVVDEKFGEKEIADYFKKKYSLGDIDSTGYEFELKKVKGKGTLTNIEADVDLQVENGVYVFPYRFRIVYLKSYRTIVVLRNVVLERKLFDVALRHSHLSFMGIPIDGTLSQFQTKLREKGFVLSEKNKRNGQSYICQILNVYATKDGEFKERVFEGKFKGREALCVVGYNQYRKDTVWSVLVKFAEEIRCEESLKYIDEICWRIDEKDCTDTSNVFNVVGGSVCRADSSFLFVDRQNALDYYVDLMNLMNESEKELECLKKQHMSFLGIPIDGTISQFQEKLIKKGFKLSSKNKEYGTGERAFDGEFKGRNALCVVSYNQYKNNIVVGVRVLLEDEGIDCEELLKYVSENYWRTDEKDCLDASRVFGVINGAISQETSNDILFLDKQNALVYYETLEEEKEREEREFEKKQAMELERLKKQHMSFLGIPIDGTISQFQEKLIKKGFKLSSKNKEYGAGERAFDGKFMGRNALCVVSYNQYKNNIVVGVRVLLKDEGIDCEELLKYVSENYWRTDEKDCLGASRVFGVINGVISQETSNDILFLDKQNALVYSETLEGEKEREEREFEKKQAMELERMKKRHLEFMGVPIDGSISLFQAKLVQKGFRVSAKNKKTDYGVRMLEGRFMSKLVDCVVWYNPRRNNQVFGVRVIFKEVATVKDELSIKDILESKYGEIAEKREDEDYLYQMDVSYGRGVNHGVIFIDLEEHFDEYYKSIRIDYMDTKNWNKKMQDDNSDL